MAGTKRRAAASSRTQKPPKEKTPIEPDDINPDDITPDDLESDETQQKPLNILSFNDLPESASNDLKDVLASSQILESGFTATLYKFDNEYSGSSKSMVTQWYEEIKSEHEIGLNYGSGRYMLIVRATSKEGKRKVKGITFRIHKSYDELKEKSKQIDPLLMAAMSGKSDGGGMNNIMLVIGIMEKLIGVFSPFIQQQQQGGNVGGINEIMIQNYKNTSELLKEMMMDNLQLINDVRRESAGVSEVYEDEEEVTGIQGFIKTFAPILEKFIPMITGTGQQAKVTIDALKATPQYQKIVKSSKDLQSLIKYMDGKHGKDKTDKLLKKLKLNRPT